MLILRFIDWAIKKFLQNKASNELIRLLRYRANQHPEWLKKDIELLEELIRN